MNKRIIAREFLFLLSSLVLIGILYIIFIFVDSNNEKRLNELGDNAIKMENFEPYLSLQQYTIEAKKNQYDYSKVDSLFPQLNSFDRQALKDYCATVEGKNYNFIKLNSRFPEFGFEKDGSHSNFNIDTYKEIQNQIKQFSKRSHYTSQKVVTIMILSIFSFTFIVRYLFYATYWSVKQLKKE
jgi:hypothetical protein